MTAVIYVLLALAAASLGLRATAVWFSPRANPLARLLASLALGGLFTAALLSLAQSYRVYELGLGLLLSLAPVGVFDLIKWWFRWRTPATRS